LYLVPDRKFPLASHAPKGRALHLVDVENLMRGPRQPVAEMSESASGYRHLAPVNGGDHVIVAVNPSLAVDASRVWPGARLLVGFGPHGADLQLLAVVANPEWIAARFDRVVVGSGDGIFAPAVVELRRLGIAVGVISQYDRLSRHLRRSATFVRLLRSPSVSLPSAA
jgi:hypothetical protein